MHFDNVERATGNPDDGVRLRIAAVASTTCSLGLCLTAGALDVHPHLQPIRRRCSSSSSSEHGWRLGYSQQAGLDESSAEHDHERRLGGIGLEGRMVPVRKARRRQASREASRHVVRVSGGRKWHRASWSCSCTSSSTMTACRDCGPSRLRPEFPEVWPRDCTACAVKSEVREVRLASKSDVRKTGQVIRPYRVR